MKSTKNLMASSGANSKNRFGKDSSRNVLGGGSSRNVLNMGNSQSRKIMRKPSARDVASHSGLTPE